MKRQLAAILYADVAGYSRLTGLDEEETHRKLNAGLNLLTEMVARHGGHKVHEAGDAILSEFQSISSAIDCAIEFQRQSAEQNAELSIDQRLTFRIGLNLGEVMHDRGDIYGDDVNLAARIQELAEPGGVCVSGVVHDQVEGKIEHEFVDLGYQKLKNISRAVRVYAIKHSGMSASKPGLFTDTLASETKPVTAGGCLCGEIRYEIRGEDLGSAYCHCRMCQRFAGAPVAVGTGFREEDLNITRGEPKIYTSSQIAERAFCSTCGSSLWTSWLSSGWFYVKTMSLDNPDAFPPKLHFCIESKMPWHEIADDLIRMRSDDSPELVALWESAGVRRSDPPRNTNLKE